MPEVSQIPILVSDLTYRVIKLFGPDGSKVFDLADGRMARIECFTENGQLRFVLVFAEKAWTEAPQLGQICYQVVHIPTRTVSPIYDHTFTVFDVVKKSGRFWAIGTMKLYPAETVWPELTKQGYFGELPQFYN